MNNDEIVLRLLDIAALKDVDSMRSALSALAVDVSAPVTSKEARIKSRIISLVSGHGLPKTVLVNVTMKAERTTRVKVLEVIDYLVGCGSICVDESKKTGSNRTIFYVLGSEPVNLNHTDIPKGTRVRGPSLTDEQKRKRRLHVRDMVWQMKGDGLSRTEIIERIKKETGYPLSVISKQYMLVNKYKLTSDY
ncbi:hypothetical protein S13b_00069 [Klebsiella phage VLCpiS13b]|uniref:hypothetical protein n=1 Tax=Klebsiella phage VLCpiS13b TaxID=2874886 RepID=UPI00233EB81B|nr:hypothetical protein PRB92_gp56 [Klebsiella phage VLCpiS13b]UVX30644.1 hypothetical protein S13b_00069 [Klebsiella phage VLCpiS13b]